MGRLLTETEYFDRVKSKHNDKYDYSNSVYVNSRTDITIRCLLHGEFTQKAGNHKYGQGCPKCAPQKQPLTLDGFISKSKSIHGIKYDYSKVNYVNNDVKITIVCPEHGEFEQLPGSHLAGNGCPFCKSSKGEVQVRNSLIKLSVDFKEQHSFDGCKNSLPLRFDFYIPKYNLVIEYDGIDHFMPNKRSRDDTKNIVRYELIKTNDAIKNKYCVDNSISVHRIPYTEFKNIDNNLTTLFKQL
jgi:very-short-patch-repair endonuclease